MLVNPGVRAVLQGTNSRESVELCEQPSSKGHVEDQVNGFGSGGAAVVCEGPCCLLCISFRETEPFVNAGPLSGVQSDACFSIKAFDCVCGTCAKAALSVKNKVDKIVWHVVISIVRTVWTVSVEAPRFPLRMPSRNLGALVNLTTCRFQAGRRQHPSRSL